MRKIWVIPDIHGCSKTLKALIEERIRPSRTDLLYFLGDYIDRGPDAKGVIDFLMSLQEDEYSIRFLKGNHEDYLLRTHSDTTLQKKILGIPLPNKFRKDWIRHGGKATLKSFGVSDVHDIPGQYIEWMKNLELYIELDSFFLVHAGFNFEIENPFEDFHSMLWIKDFKVNPEKVSHKKIIHGHVPVSLDFINLVCNTPTFDFIDLDNGIYMDGKEGFGNLVALELTSMEMVVQSNLDM